MTPFELEMARETAEQQQDQARYAQYLDGQNDAAFGDLPQYADEDYLTGYLAKLKELPRDATGRIQHYSPHQHFAFGYVDSPDPCCEEF